MTRDELADEARLLLLSDKYMNEFEATIAALEAAIPGLADVIDGRAVVMPVDPTYAMFFDPDDVCVNYGQSPWEAFCKIYRDLIAAATEK